MEKCYLRFFLSHVVVLNTGSFAQYCFFLTCVTNALFPPLSSTPAILFIFQNIGWQRSSSWTKERCCLNGDPSQCWSIPKCETEQCTGGGQTKVSSTTGSQELFHKRECSEIYSDSYWRSWYGVIAGCGEERKCSAKELEKNVRAGTYEIFGGTTRSWCKTKIMDCPICPIQVEGMILEMELTMIHSPAYVVVFKNRWREFGAYLNPCCGMVNNEGIVCATNKKFSARDFICQYYMMITLLFYKKWMKKLWRSNR